MDLHRAEFNKMRSSAERANANNVMVKELSKVSLYLMF